MPREVCRPSTAPHATQWATSCLARITDWCTASQLGQAKRSWDGESIVALRDGGRWSICVCAPPRRRCLTNDLMKHSRQVRLAAQTAPERNFAERQLSAQHQALSKFNPPTPEKDRGRDAEGLLERAAKMANAQPRDSCQLSD